VTLRVLPTPHPHSRVVVRYTLDGTEPTAASPVWRQPVTVKQTTTIRAAAFATDNPKLSSPSVSGHFELLATGQSGLPR